MHPSREEEDLLDRSTKKVKLIEGNEENQEEKELLISAEEHLDPQNKPSYKDMVVSSEFMEDDPEEIIRAVNEELFPDHINSDKDMP
ncbi:hypothetical protein SESBI_27163 [Sesbania bispinosa]|nr:hypothetical protein SESBI_27163 [Sesbania bispinosa]